MIGVARWTMNKEGEAFQYLRTMPNKRRIRQVMSGKQFEDLLAGPEQIVP